MGDDERIEEIDSDHEDAYEDDLSFYPRRVGVDDGLRRRALEYDRYGDDGESVDGTDYDLYADGDSTVSYAVQLAMKDKEDWLVDKALERIRRAQMMGQENVRLSKRELEALERKRMQSSEKEPRRKNGAPKGRKKQAEIARPRGGPSVPVDAPSYPYYEGHPGRATGAFNPQAHAARPASSSGRPRTPTAYSPRAQQSIAARPPYPPYSPERYLALDRPSSSRSDTHRPLPDDPRWVPPYRNMPHYVPYGQYSVEQSPYQAYMPLDARHGPGHEGYPLPYHSGHRSFSDGRYSSSTSNSLSPRIAPSDSETDESSEESVESEEEVVERKVSPKTQKSAPKQRSRAGRQRAKRG